MASSQISLWVTRIAGVPLALLIAFGEGPLRDAPLSFGLTVLLCAVLLGIPQGCLAALPVWRRSGWTLALLLPAMLMTGLTLMVVALKVAGVVSGLFPDGAWERLPEPPALATALVGPTCYGHYPLKTTTIHTVYVETADRSIYRLERAQRAWSAVDAVPPNASADDCATGASRTRRVPRGEVSRRVIHQATVDCFAELQVALSANGSLWQWRRNRCANEELGRWTPYMLLSPLLSVIAWVAVVHGQRRQRLR